MKTASNSRPLAECTVISCTRVLAGLRLVVAASSEACDRKRRQRRQLRGLGVRRCAAGASRRVALFASQNAGGRVDQFVPGSRSGPRLRFPSCSARSARCAASTASTISGSGRFCGLRAQRVDQRDECRQVGAGLARRARQRRRTASARLRAPRPRSCSSVRAPMPRGGKLTTRRKRCRRPGSRSGAGTPARA